MTLQRMWGSWKFWESYFFFYFSLVVLSRHLLFWSNALSFTLQILPLFGKHKVLHFNKTDARLANNDLPLDLQKLRCRVNYQALKFTPQIESLGHKLIQTLQKKGPFMALHLRYEMDMLAFSGCTQSCTEEEAEELKQMRSMIFHVWLYLCVILKSLLLL